MLTVYSTQGSPGASTTAMHLAAHWASEGREVLLIEADPAGGSLSHNLGIQFTPGSASFVASGLPILSNHLIDHAQDVLFEVADMSTDLSAYLARGKRKSKKWRASLEQVGESLYPLAQPPVSDRPRRTRPAAAAAPSAAQDPGAYKQAPPEDLPAYGEAPPMAPAPGAGYGQSHYLPPTPESQPGYGQSHYLPPTGWPG